MRHSVYTRVVGFIFGVFAASNLYVAAYQEMAIYLSNVNDAYGPLLTAHWEKKEDPQHYDYLTSQFVNPTPQRHILGIVGGNDVSLIKGNMVDLESDLRGINIPNTFCPWKQYQPPPKGQKEIVRDNRKIDIKIDVQKAHLPVYQMWAYPAVVAPEPIKNQVCVKPEKY
jgi:hypothetical protein